MSNYVDNTVTKLRASDGAIQDVVPVGENPTGVTFDGRSIWVSNTGYLPPSDTHQSNLAVTAYTEPEDFISWTSFTGDWLAAEILGTSP